MREKSRERKSKDAVQMNLERSCEILVSRQAHMMPVQRKAAGEADRQ